MRSGIAFSSILLIWIVSAIVATAMLLPDVMRSLTAVRQLQDETATYVLHNEQVPSDSLDMQTLTSYTPLNLLEKLGL